MKNSKIEWCDHTFNPWYGCTKVSPGCKNCYAETTAKRFGGKLGVWGPNGSRRIASEKSWAEVSRWNKEAATSGVRRRVFCASMADVFEDWDGPMSNRTGGLLEHEHRGSAGDCPAMMTINDVRTRLFRLIGKTQNLDWLLLTKRPENIESMTAGIWTPSDWDRTWEGHADKPQRNRQLPSNVWIGTSVENQETANQRVPILSKCKASVRFLSIEPQLEYIDPIGAGIARGNVDWVICGGESGHGSRPFNLHWAEMFAKHCLKEGIPFFMKQVGGNAFAFPNTCGRNLQQLYLRDRKGGDPQEWPAWFSARREFPTGRN